MEYAGCIVGLGNPGAEYRGTRHNLGFAVVDALYEICARDGGAEELSGAKFRCDLRRIRRPDGTRRLLAKPLTYMNLSGETVVPLLHWHRIPPERLLVVHDELDFQTGLVRLKFGGGSAGHNGIKSIAQQLGTPDFYRLRLGIGKPAGSDPSRRVLARPGADEIPLLDEAVRTACEHILIFMDRGPEAAMNALHASGRTKKA